MRKYFIVLCLLLFGFNVHSQVLISLLLGDKLNSDGIEFGLEGGLNFSKVCGLDANRSLTAFNLGFYFDMRLKNQWYLYTGVQVKSKLGADKLSAKNLNFLQADVFEEEGDYSQVMNYFLVPALAKYKFKTICIQREEFNLGG